MIFFIGGLTKEDILIIHKKSIVFDLLSFITYPHYYIFVFSTDLHHGQENGVEEHRGLGGNIIIRLDNGAFVGLFYSLLVFS